MIFTSCFIDKLFSVHSASYANAQAILGLFYRSNMQLPKDNDEYFQFLIDIGQMKPSGKPTMQYERTSDSTCTIIYKMKCFRRKKYNFSYRHK